MKRSRTSEFTASVPAIIARTIAVVALLALCGATFAGSDNAKLAPANANRRSLAPWRQAGFDAAHTAYNRFEQFLSPSNVGDLTEAWASPVGVGTLYASPIVVAGRVYIGSGDGRMYAFDAATGATLWIGTQQPLFFVDSAAGGGRLVFASALYQPLVAYDAETGAIVWTSSVCVDVRASPTFVDGVLYVASFDGTLNALDPATGVPIWSAPGKCCVYDQAPAVDDGRVFQMRTDHTLTAYDANDGTQLWSKAAFAVGTIAAAHGTLFYNEYPNVVALDEATGAQLWATPVVTAATTGAPAVADGLVFVTQSNLVALNAAAGAVVWTAPATSGWGPVVANGVVYTSSLNGEWDAFDERNGSLLWSVTVGSGCGGSCANAVPVVANGVLYLAGPDQYLRAFTISR
jgi:eukaryotic-like serine/threonine-protein kinase